jgi:putative transposase
VRRLRQLQSSWDSKAILCVALVVQLARSSVTVVKDAANRYFLSFVVELVPAVIPAINASVRIDLGLKTFAVLSTGEQVASPSYANLDRRIQSKQRKLARQVKGSKRREKTRLQIAKLHNHIADTRKDFLHKLSAELCRTKIKMPTDQTP